MFRLWGSDFKGHGFHRKAPGSEFKVEAKVEFRVLGFRMAVIVGLLAEGTEALPPKAKSVSAGKQSFPRCLGFRCRGSEVQCLVPFQEKYTGPPSTSTLCEQTVDETTWLFLTLVESRFRSAAS